MFFDNFDGERRKGYKPDDQTFFPDMVSYTDKLIGNIINKLKEEHLIDNTLIVIMGDNGTKESFTHVLNNGDLYPARKGGTSDNGTHVPLIFFSPKDLSQKTTYEGLVNLTDIYPTILDAANIEIPNKQDIDGISFWDEVTSGKQKHRDLIYTWYNANNLYTDHSELLRYAFNKDFKYYSPTPKFPEGRFFDLRTDPLEREGDYFEERKWKLRLYSGIKIKDLNDEQRAAYLVLKNEIEKHNYVAVKHVNIKANLSTLNTGQNIQLQHEVLPNNATRNNVIWHSENPKIASIDKFGMLTAHKPGVVKIKLYSWDDAYPLSANTSVEFKTEGIQDAIEITVL